MSIFGAIRHAIFGDKGPLGGQFSGHEDAAQTTGAQTTTGHAQTTSAAPTQPAAPATTPQSPATAPLGQPAPNTQPAPRQTVDVEQVLTDLAHQKGDPHLDWRTSIVDLMKLLGIDSSLDNRRELATELGYTGAKDGSAGMNIWLHAAVMRELEKNGGRVPTDLTN